MHLAAAFLNQSSITINAFEFNKIPKHLVYITDRESQLPAARRDFNAALCRRLS